VCEQTPPIIQNARGLMSLIELSERVWNHIFGRHDACVFVKDEHFVEGHELDIGLLNQSPQSVDGDVSKVGK
jgi:hypothetical protein